MKKTSFYIETLAILISLASPVAATEPSISVEKQQLIVDGYPIPSKCLAQLQTKLNGDNTVAALYLIHPEYRGCSNANIPYPKGSDDKVSVELRQGKSPHVLLAKICSVIDGSMGGYCDSLVIEIINMKYLTHQGIKNAVIARKLGDLNNQ